MYGFYATVACCIIPTFFCKYIPSNDNEMLSKILGSAILLIVMISVIVLVLVETVGIWFLNTKLSIPEERLFAANIVLQFSIVVFIVSLFQAIYNSVIISYERMNVYAYISILMLWLNWLLHGLFLL